jgi:putative ABC transport system ATP-binding protein
MKPRAASWGFVSGSDVSQPLIRVEGVGRDYLLGGRKVRALRSVTFDVPAGDFVAVMGPSGSGKSTLMNILGLLDRPTAGRHLMTGRDIGSLSKDERAGIRRREVGFVFQSFNLLARNSALENVELPLLYSRVPRRERRRRALAALEVVGLAHRSDHWPYQLSGGEQQRAAIARAIVGAPRVIFADEPTGSLDSRTGLEIIALFQQLNRGGITIVVVTHDRHVARHAGRVIAMRDGLIHADEAEAMPLNAEVALGLAGRAVEAEPDKEVAC